MSSPEERIRKVAITGQILSLLGLVMFLILWLLVCGLILAVLLS